ncbi:hypothetical protein F2Q69_00032902, partial [Brassica cretica]
MVSSSTVLLGSHAVHAFGICEKQRILAIMGSITLPITRLPLLNPTSSSFSLPPFPLSNPRRRYNFSPLVITASAVFAAPSDVNNYVPAKNRGYPVGDFMTGRQHLHVVNPSTSVDDGNIAKHDNNLPFTGLPVIDDDWNLVLLFSFSLSLLIYLKLALFLITTYLHSTPSLVNKEPAGNYCERRTEFNLFKKRVYKTDLKLESLMEKEADGNHCES